MADIDTMLAEVRRLDREATKAPWAPRYYSAKDMTDLRAIVADLVNEGVGTRFHFVSDNDNPDLITGASGNGPTSEANAAIIAYYRTAAPLLAAEVERLRAKVARLTLDNADLRVCAECGCCPNHDKCKAAKGAER